jgi:G:T-mismatch repair DNA endonuclease (very short patch repair protein)
MGNIDSKGRFEKGHKSWNEGIRKELDLDSINNQHWKEGKSILDISKELGISDRLIRIRLQENGYKIRDKTEPSQLIKDKIRNTCVKKGIQPKERFSGEVWNKGLTQEDNRVKDNIKGLLEARKYQVMPLKDSSIELKIQEFLSKLHLEYTAHKYISEIRHAYQCDIFIPVQEGIKKKIVLEMDGCYWHGCNICFKELNSNQRKQIAKDNRRTKELKGRGYKVIRLYEHEIKLMNIFDFGIKLRC